MDLEAPWFSSPAPSPALGPRLSHPVHSGPWCSPFGSGLGPSALPSLGSQALRRSLPLTLGPSALPWVGALPSFGSGWPLGAAPSFGTRALGVPQACVLQELVTPRRRASGTFNRLCHRRSERETRKTRKLGTQEGRGEVRRASGAALAWAGFGWSRSGRGRQAGRQSKAAGRGLAAEGQLGLSLARSDAGRGRRMPLPPRPSPAHRAFSSSPPPEAPDHPVAGSPPPLWPLLPCSRATPPPPAMAARVILIDFPMTEGAPAS